MVGWHHWLNGHGFGWIPGVGDGQGGLVCWGSWGHKESDMTQWLDWTELNMVVRIFLGIAFFRLEWRPFQSCGHCWVFQICWHIKCSTFKASSFRIWSSSTGIPSPPLAFFIVMLPKALLTSQSRMAGSSWVTTSSWLLGHWDLFGIACLCILLSLLNLLCFCYVLAISVLYGAHPCMKCSLGSPIFFKRPFPVYYFPLLLCIVHLRGLSYISLLFSGTLVFSWLYLSLSPCLLLLCLAQLFVKPPHTPTLSSCIYFSLGWFWSLPPVQCYEHPSIVLQVLYLLDLIPWIYLSLPVYNRQGFDLGHTWMVYWMVHEASSCTLLFLIYLLFNCI